MRSLPGAQELSIAIYEGIGGLEQIRGSWNSLYLNLSRPTFYQDWRWMFALLKYLLEETIYFITVSKHGKIVMILPIQKPVLSKKSIKFQAITFPKHKHVVLADALVNYDLMNKASFLRSLDLLSACGHVNWTFMELKGITENSDLKAILAGEKLLYVNSENAYFNWPNGCVEGSISKKFLRNIQRLAQLAELEHGPVSVRFVADPQELMTAYKIFLDLESSGWKGEHGSSSAIKHSPQLVIFYRELINLFSKDGSLQINILYINSQAVAAQLCIRTSCVWYVLKIGYEEKWKKYGVGNLLMLKFLQHASTDPGISEINLVTAPEWAERWHLNKRPVYTFRHFNSNMKGRVTKAILRAKNIFDEII